MNACHCKDYTRAAILRDAARQGRGRRRRACARSSPGCRCPRAPASRRRSFLARSSGLALAVFGGSRARAARVRARASPTPWRPRARTPCWSRSSSPAASTRSRCSRRSTTRRYQPLRPTLEAGAEPGADVRRATRSCSGTRRRRRSRRCTSSNRMTVIPAIGYTSPNQSHFTSRHFYEVGELNESGQVGWMGRWLDRNGRADNPLQGLSLDYHARARARRGAGAGRRGLLARRTTRSRRGRGRTTVKTSMNSTYGVLGRLPTSDPSARAGARRGEPGRRDPGVSSRPLYGKTITDTPAAAVYPANSGFANRLRALAKMLHMGLPIRCVAIDGNGGYDTHENQATTLTEQPDAALRRRWRRSRPTSRAGWRARRRSPTACSCTSGASSAGGPPRTARAPITARPAPRW